MICYLTILIHCIVAGRSLLAEGRVSSQARSQGGFGGFESEDKGPALRLRGSTTVPLCRQLSKADLGD